VTLTPFVMYNEPSWTPTPLPTATPGAIPDVLRDKIMFMSDRDGAEPGPLTTSVWELNKRPSYSPDGNRIICWSNRVTGRKQIWIMSLDGSQQSNLSNHGVND
jgi:WD40-like Beta Propeller Repeat